jgi:2-keto-4-pentenoate hydratase/2-oxohepta-3-ene-1,7-dioic acid hydratase in catechol pathway
MTLAEWKNTPAELKGMRAYHTARKYFSLCKIKGVVLHPDATKKVIAKAMAGKKHSEETNKKYPQQNEVILFLKKRKSLCQNQLKLRGLDARQ